MKQEDAYNYARTHGLDRLLESKAATLMRGGHNVDSDDTAALGPHRPDLVRLHRLVRERRVTTILEFGCGWSTLVMAHALRQNRDDFADIVRTTLRRTNAFELHSVDDMPEFIEIAQRRLPDDLADLVNFSSSTVRMTTFGDRICTEYEELPNIAPDFIYLDGPSQHSPLGSINGITTAHADRLPMSCDLLKIEHFLLPGTLILVDGRTANARFLQANFQRRWHHEHDAAGDVHYLELLEPPLGKHNRAQIELCLGQQWLNSIDR